MNVFDLQAKIGINTTEYKKGLSEASKEFSEVGGKIKDGAAKLAKVSTAALGAAAAGVGALVKQSVSAYAEYEQLVGGIETLFGQSAKKVLDNADKAFATAGMSANEYMETSIQGAAALINSLGGDTAKAAELMDVSIQDMSDNVNKMGTTMESIQNAYRGFSRGNFTMLDNLALGFAGTKEGMEQLLEKAEQISGIKYDISSYADIVQAIHVVQTEMGITGTTAKEAAGTITGSMSSVKAAWKNLTVEMAKADGDVGKAFTILGDNVGAVVENMLPKVEQAIGGVGELISSAAPQVINGINKLLPKVLPSLIKTAGSLVSNVGTALLTSLPELVDMGRNMLANLAYGLENSEFEGSGILKKAFDSIVNDAPVYFQYAQMIATNLANKLLDVDYGTFAASLGELIVGGINSINDFVKGVNWDKVGSNIADFINNVPWSDIASSIIDLLGTAIKEIPNVAKTFYDKADMESILSAIAVLSAPKLLGGITGWIGSAAGQAEGTAAGVAWSGAFLAGVKAFGLGWAIGTYIRQEIIKATGSEDEANKKIMDTVTFGQYSKLAEKVEHKYDLTSDQEFTLEDGRKALMYTSDGKLSASYTAYLERQAKASSDALAAFDINEYRRQNGLIPRYGDGGRVTRPTLAIVGEKEPETIIPDSKLGGVTNYNTFNINGDGLNSEEVAEKIAEVLANLSVRQQRALGGTAW